LGRTTTTDATLTEKLKARAQRLSPALSPRVRAKRMPKAERRAQLLSTAREIIQSGGIGALTMSALAEKSGASKPVVYEHFENSESVAIELLNEFYGNMVRLSHERLGNPETIFDYFDIIVDLMFDYYYLERTLVRMITNGFSANSEVNAYYLEQQEHSLAVYKELLLQQGIADKTAHVAAYALQELIGQTVQEFAGADTELERDTLKRCVNGMIHGLVSEQGIKPLVPVKLLDIISHAGEAHRHPRRPSKTNA
jgi:AcrR family transcriptional regulator